MNCFNSTVAKNKAILTGYTLAPEPVYSLTLIYPYQRLRVDRSKSLVPPMMRNPRRVLDDKSAGGRAQATFLVVSRYAKGHSLLLLHIDIFV